MTDKKAKDSYIGVSPISNYFLTKRIGQGRIGVVYIARREDPPDELACKIIPEGKLKHGWQRELEKLTRLRRIPNIVAYHGHGTHEDSNHRPFTYVLFDFIPGINLREYIELQPWPLDMAFIENIAETMLKVLLACRAQEIQHGDLHEGNILIEDPDTRLLDNPRTIWISDFGYGGSHNSVEPKDDFRQFFAIISTLLHKLNPADLNPRDKVLYAKLEEFLSKRIMEADRTQGTYVGDTTNLLREFRTLASQAERESASASRGEEIKEPGDYPTAEAMGYRADEWKSLFVPEFLAAQELLSRDITVLTGARGCGKTMAFRRLTAFMDKVIGKPSGVPGSDQFIGFYINCRDFAEAFPWLPSRLKEAKQQQIMHYFHLSWMSEIFKTLGIYASESSDSFQWIDKFLSVVFGGTYHPLPMGGNALAHARAFIESEKESCRLGKVRALSINNYPLARIDFLDQLQVELENNVAWIGGLPLYFFLDDYTIPIVPRSVQRVLNPIVFKRRSKLFFKVSTEAANSFDRQGLRKKPLELDHDFKLIDLATESLHQDSKAKTELLEKIFKPRIDRHQLLTGKRLGLNDVLGNTTLSNNELASLMRDNAKQGTYRRILYHGIEAFVGMWSSDIRTMIQIFTAILRESNGQIKENNLPVKTIIQDKIYRAKGGEFLVFAGSIIDPAFWEKGLSSTKPGESYGTHLTDIVEAFINISRDELTKGKLVKNEGKKNPKQAFRLEIIDKFHLSDDALFYYEGLIRWHIFLQDWRGKSVRGMITPRLYLNRILIPYANLTFSSHDNIHLTNDEFIFLLTTPKEFRNYWREKKLRRIKTDDSTFPLWERRQGE